MTLIYAVDGEVFLSAPRDVLGEAVKAIEEYRERLHKATGITEDMNRQLTLFANSLRAHAQHLPEPAQTEGWLDT